MIYLKVFEDYIIKAYEDLNALEFETGSSEYDYISEEKVWVDNTFVEKGYDDVYYLKGHAPQPPIEEYNEQVRNTRARLYAQLIDPLHAEKQRKEIMEEWTPELESEYVANVKELTEKIKLENPYMVE